MSQPHAKDPMMKAHIDKWQESGLSQTAYCQQAGLKLDNFNYYKKKFAQKGLAIHQQHQLIPVQLIEESVMNPQLVKLSHSNGFSLEVNPVDDLNHLKPLLSLLSQLQ